jgi:putative oxidoreductase
MLPHGLNKLIGDISYIKEGILAAHSLPSFLAYGVYIGEVLAPILIIFGLKTRIASLVLAINMIFVIILVHANSILAFEPTGAFTLEVVYFYIFASVALMFLGSGKYSIDKD